MKTMIKIVMIVEWMNLFIMTSINQNHNQTINQSMTIIIYIETYIHTYIDTYIHTYKHTYSPPPPFTKHNPGSTSSAPSIATSRRDFSFNVHKGMPNLLYIIIMIYQEMIMMILIMMIT